MGDVADAARRACRSTVLVSIPGSCEELIVLEECYVPVAMRSKS